jgi:hypothetical protein
VRAQRGNESLERLCRVAAALAELGGEGVELAGLAFRHQLFARRRTIDVRREEGHELRGEARVCVVHEHHWERGRSPAEFRESGEQDEWRETKHKHGRTGGTALRRSLSMRIHSPTRPSPDHRVSGRTRRAVCARAISVVTQVDVALVKDEAMSIFLSSIDDGALIDQVHMERA